MVANLTLDHLNNTLKGMRDSLSRITHKTSPPIISTITLDLLIFQMRMEKVNQKHILPKNGGEFYDDFHPMGSNPSTKFILNKSHPRDFLPKPLRGGKIPFHHYPQSKLPLFIKNALVNPLFLVGVVLMGVRFA